MFNIHVGLVKKYFFHIFPIEAVAWTVIIEIIDGSFAKRDKSCLHWAIKFSLTLPCLFVNPVYLTVTHNIGRKCFVVDCSWQCTVTRHSCLFPKSKMKTSLKDEKKLILKNDTSTNSKNIAHSLVWEFQGAHTFFRFQQPELNKYSLKLLPNWVPTLCM